MVDGATVDDCRCHVKAKSKLNGLGDMLGLVRFRESYLERSTGARLTREDFNRMVAGAIEAVTQIAEQRVGRELPRSYSLRWLGGLVIGRDDGIVEMITNRVFVSNDKIYPCVDLFLDDLLSDGRLLVTCYRVPIHPVHLVNIGNIGLTAIATEDSVHSNWVVRV